jgi:glycosyltransferase involved in cell wall biosynthesis
MITFIIPSINRESLSRTIDSLINQTNKFWKCIIIFDGVDGIEFTDSRIKTYKIEKLGVKTKRHGNAGLVRNFGIKMAETKWIGFLDDDDTINENYVEKLNNNYYNYDLVIWRMKDSNGRIYPDFSINDIIINKVGISFCYKTEIFKNIFFDENNDNEDFFFLEKLKNLSKNYIITNDIFYNIRH